MKTIKKKKEAKHINVTCHFFAYKNNLTAVLILLAGYIGLTFVRNDSNFPTLRMNFPSLDTEDT